MFLLSWVAAVVGFVFGQAGLVNITFGLIKLV